MNVPKFLLLRQGESHRPTIRDVTNFFLPLERSSSWLPSLFTQPQRLPGVHNSMSPMRVVLSSVLILAFVSIAVSLASPDTPHQILANPQLHPAIPPLTINDPPFLL